MTIASVGKFTTNMIGDLKQERQDSGDCHPELRAGLNFIICTIGVDMTLAFGVKYYKAVELPVAAGREALHP
jgi:hypothetical protein